MGDADMRAMRKDGGFSAGNGRTVADVRADTDARPAVDVRPVDGSRPAAGARPTDAPSLRRCTEADAPLLCAIGAETFRDTFADTNTEEDMDAYLRGAYAEPVIRAELGTEGSEFYVADLGDEPAGFLKLNFGRAQHEDMGPGMMEIERLYVRTGHKRRGVGGTMMRFALARAREAGCRGVWLGVWERNEPAKAFYMRMGFAFVGSHVFTVGSDDQTDLLMKRMF